MNGESMKNRRWLTLFLNLFFSNKQLSIRYVKRFREGRIYITNIIGAASPEAFPGDSRREEKSVAGFSGLFSASIFPGKMRGCVFAHDIGRRFFLLANRGWARAWRLLTVRAVWQHRGKTRTAR